MNRLTSREIDVVELLAEGKTNEQIAKQLYISIHTVKAILEKVYEKLAVHNRVQVAMIYAKEYLLNNSEV